MASTITGRTTTRWTLELSESLYPSEPDVSDWLALHADPANVAIPQTLSCSDGLLSITMTVGMGEGRDPLQVTPEVPLAGEPPVPVVCLHRWVIDADSDRTCMECGQGQTLDWVDVA